MKILNPLLKELSKNLGKETLLGIVARFHKGVRKKNRYFREEMHVGSLVEDHEAYK